MVTKRMKMLILGATSAIGHETAKCFASEGTEFFLVGRTAQNLEAVAQDLKVRGAKRVETCLLDLTDLERHQELIDSAVTALDGLDTVLISYGTLGDQQKCQQSVEETLKEFTANCTSVISLLTILGNYFEQQQHGCIAVVTSVAGERGRRSNYVYGSTKGAVTLFLQGLRSRLYKAGVSVVTIKPGLVDTPMTAALKKGPLFARPRTVGEGIYKAIKQRKEVVYLPWYWRYIMLVVKGLPEKVFKRLAV